MSKKKAAYLDLDNRKNDFPQETTQDSTIEAVNELLREGIARGASDIHLEPVEEGLNIRLRIDGKLYFLQRFSREMFPLVISRLKIMAGMNIAEKRLPQDGNIYLEEGKQGINIRVSTLPLIHGEKMVLRILNPAGLLMSLNSLGFNEDNLMLYQKFLEYSCGMILVTGPTGCGKTTTLYSTLKHINSPEKNIITVEDPVEYRIENVNQVQVNTKTGLTFAAALRTVLRQDPNIIMVGEIRDAETAEIATRAALTGRLVFSTLHTSDAPRAVTRLLDMGVEPYLLNSALVGVVSQRLIRLNCRHCLEEDRPGAAELSLYRKVCPEEETPVFYRGRGCIHCNYTGFKGRIAIHELMPVDETMRDLIQTSRSGRQIRNYAISRGMKTLLQDGMQRAARGETTLQEVIRETYYAF
ncbi:MAG: type II/IV secretion system protein [Firmicutes bacterium]|nr:type II/IV secretion system protein [Bacillota bacterium]